MTDIQQRLMTMADEIIDACQKKNLRYILAGNTAGRAVKYHKFTSYEYQFFILMPFRDVAKLKKYLEKNHPNDRAFESWENNCKMRRLIYRYVDVTSTLLDGYSNELFTMPGIAVTIIPVTEGEGSTELKGCQRYIQTLNSSVYKNKCNWISLTILKFASKIVGTKLLSFIIRKNIKGMLSNSSGIHYGGLKSRKMSAEEIANWVVSKHMSLNNKKNSEEKFFWYINQGCRTVNLPEDIFTSVAFVEFEGRNFLIYKDLETYFRKVYVNNWEENSVSELPESNRVRMICDCNIPYKEYLEFIKNDSVSLEKVYIHKREQAQWMKDVYYPAEKKVNHTFHRIKRSVDRIDLWYKLRNKRDEIKQAYDNQDIDKLRTLLGEYMRKTEEYRKEKIGFYIDEELFKCAKLVWDNDEEHERQRRESQELERQQAMLTESIDNNDFEDTDAEDPSEEDETAEIKTYAEKVYELVPDIYKEESVDMYFEKRGTKVI